MNRKLVIAAALVAGGAATAAADEQTIRRVIGANLSGGSIVSVQKLPRGGLYEVAVQGTQGLVLLYTDPAAEVLLVGKLLDTETGLNLTEARMRELTTVDWENLPFHWALTMKRGDGRRQIAIFADPNCPYCERFESDLARVADITVHVFMYPIIKPHSVEQTKAVWCSRDPVKAWNDLMLERIVPAASPECENPIDELLALGRRLGIGSTPTWFLRNGERHAGAISMDDLIPLLDAAGQAPGER
ncbi:MAG: DsbC family protein [Woeseiaceae bacterium]